MIGLRVVRGAMLSVVGSTEMVCAFERHEELKRLASMGGERCAMWFMNEFDEDVRPFSMGRASTENFGIGHVCKSLPRTSRI